ncbi:MAG: hypothetical protein HQ482_13575 [Sphingomonadales bacterium]|nr:hypothetical protein [Sphingomonadales bacterium]
MKKILFISVICFFIIGAGNLFSQTLRDIVKNPITKEYFLEPLREEVNKEFHYTEPEFTEKNIQETLRRAYEDCNQCFNVKTGGYYSAIAIEKQKSLAANNSFNIDFKEFISVNDFRPNEYARNFIGTFRNPPRIEDFKTFKFYYSSILKETGVKKKEDKENLYNKLLKKREELGKKLVQFYSNYDYKMQLLKAFSEKYPELYKTSKYPSDAMKTLVVEKISPNFNLIDNILMYPEFTSKKNTEVENKELKKMLLDKGFVKITEWGKESSNYVFTYLSPIINDNLKKRADTLNRYFNLRETRKAEWSYTNLRLLELWYENLGNAFTLENFLTACGSNIPSKEDFVIDDKPLKDIITIYCQEVGFRLGKNFERYDDILFDNIMNNHYGIQNDEFEKIKSENEVRKEKELNEKGGILRGRTYFKINNQGKPDELYFSRSFNLVRTINQSEYEGSFEKKSENIFNLVLTDKKTGIKFPEFEARISNDGKKLYLGEDKVPYKYEDPKEANCLYDKQGFWRSIDGKESFHGNEWKSSITGGIYVRGSSYKVSANKYAFVIYYTSWNGKLENNLVIITTDNNCDTIYYGKGKKKMVHVK